MALTAAKVKSLSGHGLHGDGRGLYLRVSASGTKSWILRISIDRRRRDVGLGAWPAVSLAKARKAADATRAAVAEGRDPVAERRRATVPTFREAALAYHAANRPRWKRDRYADQWLTTLELHAFPKIGAMPIDRIDRRDVLGVLDPIWHVMPPTARFVRARIRAVLRWGMARGFVEQNAAGEAIDGALPALARLKAHHRALPYAQIPAALEAMNATAANVATKLAMRFLILTAARSQEARRATWAEIDLAGRVWSVPGERMKGGVPHRVPLSAAALAVLVEAAAIREAGSDALFPSTVAGATVSDGTLLRLLRSAGLGEAATAHGFRSAFRDFAAEKTNASYAAAELCLAHVTGNAVQKAYFRSDLLEQRRQLMETWGAFVTGGGADVIRLERRASA